MLNEKPKINLDLCDSDSVKFDPFNDSKSEKCDSFDDCKFQKLQEKCSMPSLSSSKVEIPDSPLLLSPATTNVLQKAPKFLLEQTFLITMSTLLISIYALIILYNLCSLVFILPNLRNSEAAAKLSSDTIGTIGLILFCLILELVFIYGIQKSKEWLLLLKSIFAFILTILCLLTTVTWMNINLFNGPYNIQFLLTYFTMVPLCFLQFSSGILSMKFFIKLIYENTTQNTIRIMNQPPDYSEV